jgi:hypothetical protein
MAMCFVELLDLATARMKSATGTSHHPAVIESYLFGGNFVVTVYGSLWYIGQMEAEEPEEETAGFNHIKYMNRKAHNKFIWGVCETPAPPPTPKKKKKLCLSSSEG